MTMKYTKNNNLVATDIVYQPSAATASHKWSADRQGKSKLNPIPVQCVAGPTLNSNNVQEFKTNTVKMLKSKEISYKNQLSNCQQWRCVDYFFRVD